MADESPSRRFHWGPAWQASEFSWLPRQARQIMRDELDLSVTQMVVMETLVSFRKEDSFLVWASLETIADRCGLNYHTGARAVRALMSRGLIQQHAGSKRGVSRTFDLHHFLALMAARRAAIAAPLRVL